MASRVQWRRFTFFEKDNLCEDLKAKIGANVTCMSATEEGIFFGDDLGRVTYVDSDFKRQREQEAYRGVVTAIGFAAGRETPALFTAGDDTDGMTNPGAVGCVFKVWSGPDLKQMVRLIDVSAATTLKPYVSMTAFAHTTDGTMVAFGFESGEILFYQGDLSQESQKIKPAIIKKPSQEDQQPVTSLHFCERPIPQKEGAKSVKLFACYKELPLKNSRPPLEGQGIVTYMCPVSSPPSLTLLDERGVSGGTNVAYNSLTHELVVGRSDGVYFYTPEDRGSAAGFEGDKQGLACLKNYILVASLDGRGERTALNVYDMSNKFIAFHLTLPAGQAVQFISCSSTTAFFTTQGGTLLRLQEKDTSSKLDLLFRKNLYPIAISLAYSSSYDVGAIMDIYRMYGDHLYKKCDFDAAMVQYCHTIGYLEPSYVIRRFLDAQRINNLTSYLEQLHSRGYGTSDHTTLLLNCYTKLKEVEKLDRFIRTEETPQVKISEDEEGKNGSKSMPDGPKFDVNTALRVLKSSGYYDHAQALAKAHNEHDWFLKTQLDRPQPDYSSALNYVAALPPSEAETYLQKHGKVLVKNLPEETTGLLMILCTGKHSQKSHVPSPRAGNGFVGYRAKPESFIHLYVNHPESLLLFLEFVVKEEGGASAVVGNTLLELLLSEWKQCSEKSGDNSQDLIKQKLREEDMLTLLSNPKIDYDKNHILVLFQLSNFRPGLLRLYETMGMVDMALYVHMETKDTRSMLRLCRREGRANPALWLKVLSYFVDVSYNNSKNKEAEKDVVDELELWNDLKELLVLIDREQILQPVEVLQALSRYPTIPLGVGKEYIIKHVIEINKEIDEMQAQAEELNQSTNFMKLEIQSLRSHSQLFGNLPSSKLELPTSFILENMDQGLPVDGDMADSERKKIEEIKRSQQQKANDHEQFFKDLEESTDGYTQVATYFGKGVLR